MLDIGDLILVCMVVAVALFAYGCATSTVEGMISLGDEVETTTEYKDLFNDSFSGRVFAKDGGMYTVRDENGTERTFEWKWIDPVDAEEVI